MCKKKKSIKPPKDLLKTFFNLTTNFFWGAPAKTCAPGLAKSLAGVVDECLSTTTAHRLGILSAEELPLITRCYLSDIHRIHLDSGRFGRVCFALCSRFDRPRVVAGNFEDTSHDEKNAECFIRV